MERVRRPTYDENAVYYSLNQPDRRDHSYHYCFAQYITSLLIISNK